MTDEDLKSICHIWFIYGCKTGFMKTTQTYNASINDFDKFDNDPSKNRKWLEIMQKEWDKASENFKG